MTDRKVVGKWPYELLYVCRYGSSALSLHYVFQTIKVICPLLLLLFSYKSYQGPFTQIKYVQPKLTFDGIYYAAIFNALSTINSDTPGGNNVQQLEILLAKEHKGKNGRVSYEDVNKDGQADIIALTIPLDMADLQHDSASTLIGYQFEFEVLLNIHPYGDDVSFPAILPIYIPITIGIKNQCLVSGRLLLLPSMLGMQEHFTIREKSYSIWPAEDRAYKQTRSVEGNMLWSRRPMAVQPDYAAKCTHVETLEETEFIFRLEVPPQLQLDAPSFSEFLFLRLWVLFLSFLLPIWVILDAVKMWLLRHKVFAAAVVPNFQLNQMFRSDS